MSLSNLYLNLLGFRLVFLTLSLLGSIPLTALAQTGLPLKSLSKTSAGSVTAAAPTPAPKKEPEEKKPFENLRLSYFSEWDGPRFSNFDLLKSQGPTADTPDYGALLHVVKLGYAVSKRVTLGFQFVGIASFDPASPFNFKDVGNFLNWGKMVETKDLEIQGVLIWSYPTSADSIAKGKICSVRAQGNWTFKTALRNWTFTTATKLTSSFFKNPMAAEGTSDFAVALEPYITVDVSPNVQWVFEGSFDANHTYMDPSFDFRQADPDSFDTGPSFNLNSHASVTTTVKFYTQNISFSTATPYVNLSLSL